MANLPPILCSDKSRMRVDEIKLYFWLIINNYYVFVQWLDAEKNGGTSLHLNKTCIKQKILSIAVNNYKVSNVVQVSLKSMEGLPKLFYDLRSRKQNDKFSSAISFAGHCFLRLIIPAYI